MEKKKTFKMDPVAGYIFDTMTVDKETLRYLLTLLDPEIANKMIFALAGIYNPVKMVETMPQTSIVYSNTRSCDYSECKFREFDFFENRVYFDYHKTSYRVFKTQEEANDFSKNGGYDWKLSKDERVVSDEHPYLGVYDRDESSFVDYDSWIKNAYVE